MIRKNINRILILVLGSYQILGGLFGLTLVFRQSLSYVLWNFLYFALIIGLFIFSIVSGIYLLKSKSLKKGIRYSLVNQILQLIQFEVLGVGLYFVAGSYVSYGLSNLPSLHLVTDYSIFRSSCYLSIFRESNEIVFNINIVAIILISYLLYLSKMLLSKSIK